MKLFLQHCADRVTGVLSGFDRLMLHGSLRLFAYQAGCSSTCAIIASCLRISASTVGRCRSE